jgi:hypothetical protein
MFGLLPYFVAFKTHIFFRTSESQNRSVLNFMAAKKRCQQIIVYDKSARKVLMTIKLFMRQ